MPGGFYLQSQLYRLREHEHGALTDKAFYAVVQKKFAFMARVRVKVLE